MANRKVQTTMYKTLHRKQRPSNTNQKLIIRGGSKGGRTLKLEKIWFFGIKSWFFTRNTTTIFAPPSARPNFFKCALPPNLNSWIRPWSCYHFAGYFFFCCSFGGDICETNTDFLVPAPLISEDARAFRQITHVSRVVVEPDVTVETVTTTRVNVLDVLDTN